MPLLMIVVVQQDVSVKITAAGWNASGTLKG